MEPPTSPCPPLTYHATCRSRARRIPPATIDAVVTYGRCRHARGAEIYMVGWRDVAWWAALGIDLSALEGLEVVCGNSGRVITVYRKRKRRTTGGHSFFRAA